MFSRLFQSIAGPRVSDEELVQHRLRYRLPGTLLLVARVFILVSLFLPYWHMVLVAPQYPDNLQLTAYVNHLAGDVSEIDSLNHYIGMRPLNDAARFERIVGVYVLIGLVVFLEIAAWMHSRWSALLVIPTILFPGVFLLDLYLWMSHFGQNLDPLAPLSSAIDPFVPPILGKGVVGQFETHASAGAGLMLATAASVIIVVALYFHRRAYKPIVMEALPLQMDAG
jgi:hypothetical protein